MGFSKEQVAGFRPVPEDYSFLGGKTSGLFDVWNFLRGPKPAPYASDFDLLNHPELVPSLCMLEVVDEGSDYRIGFLGTEFSKLFGQAEKGALWSDFEGQFGDSETTSTVLQNSRSILEAASSSLTPILNGPKYLEWTDRKHIKFEGLTVPLINQDGKATKLVGAVEWIFEDR